MQVSGQYDDGVDLKWTVRPSLVERAALQVDVFGQQSTVALGQGEGEEKRSVPGRRNTLRYSALHLLVYRCGSRAPHVRELRNTMLAFHSAVAVHITSVAIAA